MDFGGNFWDILLWTLWIFAVVCLIWIWIRIIFDLFSDHGLGGWPKFFWTVFLIVMPWLAVFVYLIARGKGMQERSMVAAEQQKASTDAYIKNVAAQTKTPAEQIADAQGLLTSGAITQDEFDALKAKALAS
ncbi:MAG: SHOCT domain-containing protein [Actinomycetota bacterium]|nr:SHOCT domain-containing protein [Actinomycetota bacterium]